MTHTQRAHTHTSTYTHKEANIIKLFYDRSVRQGKRTNKTQMQPEQKGESLDGKRTAKLKCSQNRRERV